MNQNTIAVCIVVVIIITLGAWVAGNQHGRQGGYAAGISECGLQIEGKE